MKSVLKSLLNRLPLAVLALASNLAGAAPAAETRPDPEPVPLTMEALVNELLTSNPELAFYRAEIAAAKGEQRTAKAFGNPELSVSGGLKRAKDITGNLVGEGGAWTVALQQPFEWPGRLALRKSIANQQLALAELGLENFRTSLAARGRTLAYSVLAAQQMADSCVRQVQQKSLGHGRWVKRGGADSEPFSSPRHRPRSCG